MLYTKVGEVADTLRRRSDDSQYVQNVEETQCVPPISTLTEGLQIFETSAVTLFIYMKGCVVPFCLYVAVVFVSS
jgi:hypothetical protein